MAEHRSIGGEHKLILLNREQMDISGTIRVESFNPEEIVLETNSGLLNIKGEKLDVKNINLERGQVEIVGVVAEIRYCLAKAQGRRGFFNKLFR